MKDEEPFGTTPLPVESGGGSLEVTVDLWTKSKDVAQQPQTQQIAVFEAKPDEECINGSLLDVNQHFVVYVVKNGLIRILHRHSSLKALLRGHQGHKVTDISFFLDGDVLATVGHAPDTGSSKLIVWRVFEQSPEIQSEKLLEISSQGTQMKRLLWHPFNPNQVWVLHGKEHQVATLVETTRMHTSPHPEENHPVCHWQSPDVIMEGAVQLQVPGSSLEDLAWSGRDTRHVLTVHSNGSIILWDLKQKEDSTLNGISISVPKQLAVVEEPSLPQSRCLFLPHENAVRLEGQSDTLTNCFVTASQNNTVVTLWSSFTGSSLPVRLQVLKLANPSPSYVLGLCFGPAPQEASPPSCFLLWADRHKGELLAIHVASQWSAQNKALCVGGDYVVPFVMHYPVYSWSVVCAPTQDISDDDIAEHQGLIFDMKLFSYQSKAVQCLTLTSYMCLPPEQTFNEHTLGVSAQNLTEDCNGKSELDTVEPGYDEEYDVDEDDDDDDDDDDEEEESSSAAAAPLPMGGIANPFANWLGAIAGTAGPPVDPPPPPAAASLPPPGLGATERSASSTNPVPVPLQPLLNPLDFFNKGPPDAEQNNDKVQETNSNKLAKSKVKKQARSKSPKGKNKNKRDAASPFPEGTKISILKREDKSPPAPAPTTSYSAPPNDPAIVASAPPPPPPSGTDPRLEAILRRAVAKELAKNSGFGADAQDALTATMVPAVNKAVQESLAAFGRPLQSSMDRLGQKGVRVDPKDVQAALDLETPIKAALADAMRNVFIPAVESISAQILQKATLPPPPIPAPDTKIDDALEILTKQLVAMSSKMEEMYNEIKSLKANGRGGDPPMPPPPGQVPPPPNQIEAARNEISALLQQKQYQAAFTKAVSTSSTDMAIFACSRANVHEVLGGNSPQLSQTILLCLMQQLGAALLNTTAPDVLNLELEWLQEISLTLNPTDHTIQRHVPAVLQQLTGSVNQKMNQGNPQMRRPMLMLLQVIRGMQVT